MKKYSVLLLAGIIYILATISCSNDDKKDNSSGNGSEVLKPVAIQKTNKTKIYMHYMTWFETKESSADQKWGYHWTMANKNPDVIDANGQREIASFFHPLIGPYHSGDKDVIENHLLLMKYAGVDGVLIDWYGIHDLNDYKMIKENTEQFVAMLDKVGLEYAIVYEDRFLKNIVDAGLAPTLISAAKSDFSYLQKRFFNTPNYIKINDKPLLLTFGPITLQSPEDWTSAFSGLTVKPTFLTLWNESSEAGANASGEYAWVYQDNSYLSDFYTNNVPKLQVAFGGAYPGFKDFYKEGGAGDSIGWTIDHNNGITFDETLQLAKNANLDYLQLITWNDFGEGTMIEPTVEFKYSYLDKIKEFAGVQNTTEVFENINNLYTLRKKYKSNSSIQEKLDKVFNYYVSTQAEKANQLVKEIQ